MKKFVWFFLILLLVGCQKEAPPVVDEEAVIIVDDEEYHNTRLYSYNNSIPHIIRYYEDMDDEVYGTYRIEMYDNNFDPVWRYDYRDLERTEAYARPPLIYEDKLVVNVQGIVSVLDLLTGQFLYEVETSQRLSDVYVKDDELYVLYYEDHLISVFDIHTGETLRHIDYDVSGLNDLYVNDKIIAFERTDDDFLRNALAFDLDGNFDKRMRFHEEDETKVVWDLAESSDESETASAVIDMNRRTSWHENVKGYGEKEWIELTRMDFTVVKKLFIYNGDHSSEKNYMENAKIKVADISIGDGKSFTYIFDEFVYDQVDVIEFVKPITADYVFITIVEVEPGTMFKNTTISEIYTE